MALRLRNTMALTVLTVLHPNEKQTYKGADTRICRRRGANPPGGTNMILANFPKNCMTVRKFWAMRGVRWGVSLGSATATRPNCVLLEIETMDNAVIGV